MSEYKKKGKTSVVTANEFGKLPPQVNDNLYLCIAVQL